MSGGKRPTVLMGQETEVSGDADQQHVTNMFDALGYHTYHSIKVKRSRQRRTASGVLVALDKDTFKDHEVLGVVDIVSGKASSYRGEFQHMAGRSELPHDEVISGWMGSVWFRPSTQWGREHGPVQARSSAPDGLLPHELVDAAMERHRVTVGARG